MVDAGYLAKLVSEPEWEISLEPTISPIKAVKLGATAFILCLRYSWSLSLNSICSTTLSEKLLTYKTSVSDISWPMEILAASIIYWAFSSSKTIAARSSFISSLMFSRFSIKFTNLEKIKLSLTIFYSSGKCHENHSFNLIQKVLIFLSIVSIKAIA